MKINSSKYLFVLGSLVFGLVLLVLILTSWFELWVPKSQKTLDAGNSLTTHVDPSFTSFETGENLRQLNLASAKHIHSYGLLNNEKDFVHVPIEKAFDHLLILEGKK